MKAFFVILFVAVAVAEITEEQRQKAKKLHEDCQADPATQVDETLLKKLIHGEKVTVPNLGAHSLCISKGAGFQKDNGDLDLDVLKEKVSKHVTDTAKVDEIVKECGQKQDTPEDTARHLFKCLHDHAVDVHHNDEHHDDTHAGHHHH